MYSCHTKRYVIKTLGLIVLSILSPARSFGAEVYSEMSPGKAAGLAVRRGMSIARCAVKYETMKQDEVRIFMLTYLRNKLQGFSLNFALAAYSRMSEALYQHATSSEIKQSGGCHNLLTKTGQQKYLPNISLEREMTTDNYEELK